MSSITQLPNGRRAIQFFGLDGVRRTFRLGKVSQKDAERVRLHLDELVVAHKVGRPNSPDTEMWLAKVGDELHDKLLKFGLVESRSAGKLGLAAALDATIAHRTDWKPATRRAMVTTRRRLVEHFGESRAPRTINLAQAKDYRRWLATRYAPATVSKMIKSARSFFSDMAERKIIRENPFAKVETGSQENAARFEFVERDAVAKVLEACVDDEWRAIVVLARYGGLRTPSETLLLRWSDVLWDKARFRVRSPKTEAKGKSERWTPLFPEIRDALLKLREGGVESEDAHVVTLHRYTATNFRDNLLNFIAKAGLKPWPKVWQNLRSTCATELVERGHPVALVAQWIGNTPKVLERHYMQLRDSQYGRAAQSASVTASQGVSKEGETPFSEPKTEDWHPSNPHDAPADGPGRPNRNSGSAGDSANSRKSAADSASPPNPVARSPRQGRIDERPSWHRRSRLTAETRLTLMNRKVLRLADRAIGGAK